MKILHVDSFDDKEEFFKNRKLKLSGQIKFLKL